jgi:hypothetical protein
MVSLAGPAAAGADDAGAPDAEGAEGADADGFGGATVGGVTGSVPPAQPVTARTVTTVMNNFVGPTRLLIPHLYRIRSRHACHLAARP